MWILTVGELNTLVCCILIGSVYFMNHLFISPGPIRTVAIVDGGPLQGLIILNLNPVISQHSAGFAGPISTIISVATSHGTSRDGWRHPLQGKLKPNEMCYFTIVHVVPVYERKRDEEIVDIIYGRECTYTLCVFRK